MFIASIRPRAQRSKTLNKIYSPLYGNQLIIPRKISYNQRAMTPIYSTRSIPNINSNTIIYNPSKQKIYNINKNIYHTRSYTQNLRSVSNLISPINNFSVGRYMPDIHKMNNIYTSYPKQTNSMKDLLSYQNENIVHQPVIKVKNYTQNLTPKIINDFSNYENVTPNYNIYKKPEFNYTVYNNSDNLNLIPKPTLTTYNKTDINVSNYNNQIYDYNDNYLEPPEDFDPNEFQLLKLIGIGGFSEIFSCKWKRNGKIYVMKKLISSDINDINNERKQAKVVINFIRSTGCDGVIKIYGEKINPSTGSQCILMEYAESDWENEINKKKASYKYYSEYELMNILNQLIKTMALLEKYNITHRDIKTKNILIAKGKYKVSDFSDSKVIPEGRAKLLVRGTELFMSPLLLKAYHQSTDVIHDSYKSDVYSLGMCALYAANLSTRIIDAVRAVGDDRRRMSLLMSKFGNRYSTKLIKILYSMSQPDERKRPNFTQLEAMLY